MVLTHGCLQVHWYVKGVSIPSHCLKHVRNYRKLGTLIIFTLKHAFLSASKTWVWRIWLAVGHSEKLPVHHFLFSSLSISAVKIRELNFLDLFEVAWNIISIIKLSALYKLCKARVQMQWNSIHSFSWDYKYSARLLHLLQGSSECATERRTCLHRLQISRTGDGRCRFLSRQKKLQPGKQVTVPHHKLVSKA